MRRPSANPGPRKLRIEVRLALSYDCFEDEGNVQRAGHAFDDFRHEERVLFALNDAGAGDEEKIAGADADAFDLE